MRDNLTGYMKLLCTCNTIGIGIITKGKAYLNQHFFFTRIIESFMMQRFYKILHIASIATKENRTMKRFRHTKH